MFMKVFAMITVLVALTASSVVYGEEELGKERQKLYQQLIDQEKDEFVELFGTWRPDGFTPENIEDLTMMKINAGPGRGPRISLLQGKISFIRGSGLYPTLENVMKVAFSDEDDSIYAEMTPSQLSELIKDRSEEGRKYFRYYYDKIRAFRILASECMPLEKDHPSVEQVKKFLENCQDIGIIVSGIPLLTKLDKEEGFHFTDKILKDENVPAETKKNLAWTMKHYFGYPNGKQ